MFCFCTGSSKVPKTVPGKIVHIFLYLTSIVLYNYYTSQLLSSIIDSPTQLELKDLYELGDSHFEIGFENFGYTSYLIRVVKKKRQFLVNSN